MSGDLNVWGPECPSWDLNVWDPNVQDLNVRDLKVLAPSQHKYKYYYCLYHIIEGKKPYSTSFNLLHIKKCLIWYKAWCKLIPC